MKTILRNIDVHIRRGNVFWVSESYSQFGNNVEEITKNVFNSAITIELIKYTIENRKNI